MGTTVVFVLSVTVAVVTDVGMDVDVVIDVTVIAVVVLIFDITISISLLTSCSGFTSPDPLVNCFLLMELSPKIVFLFLLVLVVLVELFLTLTLCVGFLSLSVLLEALLDLVLQNEGIVELPEGLSKLHGLSID